MRKDRDKAKPPSEHAAGNGILSRRIFLESRARGRRGRRPASRQRRAEPLPVPRWMKEPGAAIFGLRPAVAIREQGGAAPLRRRPIRRRRASAPRARRCSCSTA